MRVLVVGGTGFIGPFVVRRLYDQGHAVTVYHRGQSHADLPPDVSHLYGDRAELPARRDEIARLAPDVVLDMRAMTEDDAHMVAGTVKGIAERLVAISSQDVYRAYGRLIRTEPGPPDPVPLAEDAPLREKRYPYRAETPRPANDPRRWTDDYDKILVERVVLGNPNLPGTVLRLPMVYGPRDGQHRLFEYLKRMDDGRPAILLDQAAARWHWTRGYVENVAAAIALAATDERAAGRVYNVGESNALTLADWIHLVGRHASWSGEVITLPADRLPPTLRAEEDVEHDLVADTTRIRAELGYAEPVPLDDGLLRTIEWERANPPAAINPATFDYAAEDAALASG